MNLVVDGQQHVGAAERRGRHVHGAPKLTAISGEPLCEVTRIRLFTRQDREQHVKRVRATLPRLLLGLALLITSACAGQSGPGDLLAQLQSDPMAAWTPAQGKLIENLELEYNDGGLLGGKQSPASLTRIYQLPDQTAAASAARDGRQAAQDADWQPLSSGSSGLSKPVHAGNASLRIAPTGSDPSRLRVSLTASR